MRTWNGAKADIRSEAAPDPFGIIGEFGVTPACLQESDRTVVRLRTIRAQRRAAGFAHAQQRKRKRRVLVKQPFVQVIGLVTGVKMRKQMREGFGPRTVGPVEEAAKTATHSHFYAGQPGPGGRM